MKKNLFYSIITLLLSATVYAQNSEEFSQEIRMWKIVINIISDLRFIY